MLVEDGHHLNYSSAYVERNRDIVNAQVVADVGKVLERAASVDGRKGHDDQPVTFARDDRLVSEEWREIQVVVTELTSAPPMPTTIHERLGTAAEEGET